MILGPKFPVEDLSKFDVVVVAKVDRAVHSTTDRYHGLQSFDLTVLKCLKGRFDIGDHLSGKSQKEEARAVCPVHLTEGSDYLLLLTKSIQGYQLSRFSFTVEKGYTYFDDYIDQIEKSLQTDLGR